MEVCLPEDPPASDGAPVCGDELEELADEASRGTLPLGTDEEKDKGSAQLRAITIIDSASIR
jgi:hypothetical protein